MPIAAVTDHRVPTTALAHRSGVRITTAQCAPTLHFATTGSLVLLTDTTGSLGRLTANDKSQDLLIAITKSSPILPDPM